jgi:hypothetical protein
VRFSRDACGEIDCGSKDVPLALYCFTMVQASAQGWEPGVTRCSNQRAFYEVDAARRVWRCNEYRIAYGFHESIAWPQRSPREFGKPSGNVSSILVSLYFGQRSVSRKIDETEGRANARRGN